MKSYLPNTAEEYDQITHWKKDKLPNLPPEYTWINYCEEPAVCEKARVGTRWYEGRHGLLYPCRTDNGHKIGALIDAYNGVGNQICEVYDLPDDQTALELLAQWFWMGVV